MGIRFEFLDVMNYAANAATRKDSVWVMGAANCSFSPDKANHWLDRNGYSNRVAKTWAKDPEPIFKAMDFNSYTDVDLNDLARKKIDLTAPLSKTYHEVADMVVDAGTLEHIFDLPTALFNMNRILKPGGVILHITPINFFQHGFVNVNPSLYQSFYGVNGYTEIFLTFQVTLHNPFRIPRISPWMPLKFARFNLPYGKTNNFDWVRLLTRLAAISRLPRNLLLLAAFRKEHSIDTFTTPMDVWND